MTQPLQQPIQGSTGKVAKVPVVIQMEKLECGAACLTMILGYFGKFVPLEQIREDCSINRDGVNVKILIKVAQSYGLKSKIVRCGIDALRQQGTFPCIAHWNFTHFVVCNGIKGNKVYLNDPSKGARTVSLEEFTEAFTGICMFLEPTESFIPDGQQESTLEIVKRKLKGTGAAVAFVVLTTIITSIISLINPAFSRVFMDYLITGTHVEWLRPVIHSMALLVVVNLVVSAIRSHFNYRVNGSIAAIGATEFFWHVLHVPLRFFSQRSIGDIQTRQSINETLSSIIVNTIAPLFLDTILLVLYLVVILRYSVFLSFIGIASMLLNIFVSRWSAKKQLDLNRVSSRDGGLLSGATLGGINMAETIKASGAETGFFGIWAGYQANVYTSQSKTAAVSAYIGSLSALISSLCNMLVLFIGVLLVIQGEFTVGMVFAFQGYLAQFVAPVQVLTNANASLIGLRSQIERLDDVMKYPEDEVFKTTSDSDTSDSESENSSKRKLSGEIEVNNITFGYSKFTDPLIDDMSFKITPGSKVAFVGFSGCGKSTIARLLTGIEQPMSGEILFDGKPINSIDRSVFTSSVAVVDQNIMLFSDSFNNNVKMYDVSIEDFEVILAAKDAQIHDDIISRQGGYQYRLSEDGSDLSGGQRQRVEIARALAQDPTILILDEATSALDAATEQRVMEAVSRRGITVIIIAHRLSTIRDCDQIFVMQKGQIVDRGTHEELFDRGGLYTSLVSND